MSGVSSYIVYQSLNGGAFQAASPVSTGVASWSPGSSLASGTYRYRVQAIDGAGNGSAWSADSSNVVVDRTAPAAGSCSPGTGTYAGSVSVSCSAGADQGSPTTAVTLRYTEQAGGTPSDPSCSSSTWSNHSYSSTTTLKVRTCDAVGNQSSVTSYTYTITGGTGPILSASPANSSGWRTTATSITLNVSDSDGVSQARYNWDSAASSSVGTVFTNGNSISSPAGSHTLYLWARDNLGSESTASFGPYQYDGDAPTPPGQPSCTSPTSGIPTCTWSASTDSGGSGLSGYNVFISLNGGSFTSASPSATAVASWSPGSSLASGTYRLRVYAYDGAGNVSSASPDSLDFIVDRTAPAAGSCSPGTGSYASSVSVSCSAGADQGSPTTATTLRYTEQAGGTPADPTCASPAWSNHSYSNTTTLKVRTCDAVGNQSSVTSYTYTITAGGAPSINFNPVSRSWSSSNISVTVTASDADGISYTRHCWVASSSADCDPGTTAASTFTNGSAITQSSDGSWKLCIRARDTAGNWNPSPVCSSPYEKDSVAPAAGSCNPGTGTYASSVSVSCSAGADQGSVTSPPTSLRYTESAGGTPADPTCASPAWSNKSYSATTTLKVATCDQAGNRSSVTTYAYTISGGGGDGPTVTCTPPNSGGWQASATNITLNVTDPEGVASARYNWDSPASSSVGTVFTNPTSITSAAGSHTLYHWAQDSGSSSQGARVDVTAIGTNMQMYQYNLTVVSSQQYRLTFDAYSNTGRDVNIYLHDHDTSPYTNYGLSYTPNLTTSWQSFSTTFTASGFSGTVNDGRFRIWFVNLAQPGDTFWFDNIVLERVSSPGNMLTNGDFESGTSGWSWYSNGTATFTTESYGSGGGNESTGSCGPYQYDNQNPTPSGQPACSPSPNGTGLHTCTWTAGTDSQSGVAGYYVYQSLNGGAFQAAGPATSAVASWSPGSSLASGTYRYQVYTYDGASRTSGVSPTSGDVLVDRTAPAAGSCSPGTGSYASSVSVSCSAGADQGSPTTATTLRYTEQAGGTPADPTCASPAWSNKSYSATTTLKVRTCDAVGNQSSVTSYTYTITGGAGPVLTATPGSSSGWRTTATSITLNVSDSDGVSQARYNWDSAASSSVGTIFNNGNSISSPAGSHTLYLWARDNLGSESTANFGTYQYDNVAPRVFGFSVQTTPTRTAPTLSWSPIPTDTGGSSMARFELWRAPDASGSPGSWSMVVGNIPASSTSGQDTTASTSGLYWYGMHAVDNAGNCITESGSHCGGVASDSLDGSRGVFGPDLLTFDNQPPQASNRVPPVSGTVSSLRPTMSCTLSDNLTGVGASTLTVTGPSGQVLNKNFSSGTTSLSVASGDWSSLLENGSYTARLQSVDGVGNTLDDSTWTFTVTNQPPNKPAVN